MFKRFKLERMIKTNKCISKELKKRMIKMLKKNYALRGFKLKKDLFYSMMESRAYDIYTSSIITLFYNNPTSLNTLIRGQLENLGLINYLSGDIKIFEKFFNDSFKFEKYAKELGKIDPKLVNWWVRCGKHVHPTKEGLKLIFTDVIEMAPKNPETANLLLKNKKSLTNKEIEENFDLIPSLMKEGVPHKKIKKEEFEKIARDILSLYVFCLKKLESLYASLPDSKMIDHKELWKMYNKKKSNPLNP